MSEIKIFFDLNEAIEKILEKKWKNVALQVPEGFKLKLEDIVKEIETKSKAKIVVMPEPCFGACDLKDDEAKKIGCQAIIHFGHNKFLIEKESLPTIYVPLYYEMNLKEKMQMITNAVKNYEKIALVSNIQFLPYLKDIKKELEESGKKVFIGKAGRGMPDGQILGCNYTAATSVEKKIDCTIYFGDGLFRPLGIVFGTDKPVITINPIANEVNLIGARDKEILLRKRYAVIGQAMNAKTFGIIVTTKKGQNQMDKAELLKKEFEKHGKHATIYIVDFVSPSYFIGINVDCFVNTACPRIGLDDYKNYTKPLLNFSEALMVAKNKLAIENFKVDEMTE